jgi:hypothetical protein
MFRFGGDDVWLVFEGDDSFLCERNEHGCGGDVIDLPLARFFINLLPVTVDVLLLVGTVCRRSSTFAFLFRCIRTWDVAT